MIEFLETGAQVFKRHVQPLTGDLETDFHSQPSHSSLQTLIILFFSCSPESPFHTATLLPQTGVCLRADKSSVLTLVFQGRFYAAVTRERTYPWHLCFHCSTRHSWQSANRGFSLVNRRKTSVLLISSVQ